MRYLLASVLAFVALVGSASAEFTVYLSDKDPASNPVAGLLNMTGLTSGATGSLYLYGDGDTQLSGLSLDLLETGGAVKFTSATVNNPGGRWSFLDGPLTIGDSMITNIGGAAIPPGAPGVGGPIEDEIAGVGFLLATIGYEAISNATSNLQLRVGSNLIADYEGNGAMVRLGGPGNDPVNGETQGLTGNAGLIMVGGDGDTTPPLLTALTRDFELGVTDPSTLLNLQLTATDETSAASALVWSNLLHTPPAEGTNAGAAATMGADGLFNWNPDGWRGGIHTFNATVADEAGNEVGGLALTVNLTVPEPATLSLLGLALVGFVGAARRRG